MNITRSQHGLWRSSFYGPYSPKVNPSQVKCVANHYLDHTYMTPKILTYLKWGSKTKELMEMVGMCLEAWATNWLNYDGHDQVSLSSRGSISTT
jgi:hypothetical protein